ncbi:MAG: hypothetical protein SGPRY_004610, partial [Prymnesium sp.]
KAKTLLDIRAELANPFADSRGEHMPLEREKLFELLTAENARSLGRGALTTGKLVRYEPRPDQGGRFHLQLQCGLPATVEERMFSDKFCESFDLRPNPQLMSEEMKGRSLSVKVEAVLSSSPPGDLFFRPSSKGMSHLTASVKVSEGKAPLLHIDIVEEDKPAPAELGASLWVGRNKEKGEKGERFEDLDEICARHVEPLLANIAEMCEHRKYAATSLDAIERQLREAKEKGPNIIPYHIVPHAKMPDHFVLACLPSRNHHHPQRGHHQHRCRPPPKLAATTTTINPTKTTIIITPVHVIDIVMRIIVSILVIMTLVPQATEFSDPLPPSPLPSLHLHR